ncbi:ATP-binding protein [Limibacter armeniacum]|uniref:ATP-binding protein n=1 Tax=Limibacter armeniacum TaxID=466084 RepID=UPI002FE69FA0
MKISFNCQSFNIHDLAISLREMHQLRAEKKKLNLRLSVDNLIPEQIIGDEARLLQVLNNLIENAIKFTSEGDVSLVIELLSSDEHFLTINFSVSDTGEGIPPNKMAFIFDPFNQLESEVNKNANGTGLGLAITRHILEQMGSSIEVKSEVGKGSSFTFKIRFEKEMQVASDNASYDNETQTFEEEGHFKGKNILIVDDNDGNLMIMEEFANYWGFETYLAKDGIEAIDKIKERELDIVLMDIAMPQMNGYETSHVIRNEMQISGEKLPIIALTAVAMVGTNIKIREAGMNDYVTKPFSHQDLFKKLKNYLN